MPPSQSPSRYGGSGSPDKDSRQTVVCCCTGCYGATCSSVARSARDGTDRAWHQFPLPGSPEGSRMPRDITAVVQHGPSICRTVCGSRRGRGTFRFWTTCPTGPDVQLVGDSRWTSVRGMYRLVTSWKCGMSEATESYVILRFGMVGGRSRPPECLVDRRVRTHIRSTMYHPGLLVIRIDGSRRALFVARGYPGRGIVARRNPKWVLL